MKVSRNKTDYMCVNRKRSKLNSEVTGSKSECRQGEMMGGEKCQE